MTASPKVFHRLVAFEIASQIREHIRKCGNGAFVLQDICVRLARDGSDVVRPDVALVFDPGQLAERYVIGAPDFVAEVVSPLTRKRIMTSKVKKYLVAGVKIYWIIDLKKRQIIVYDFTDDEFSPVIRELKGKLRLDLSGCECDIELDHISELVAKNRRYV
jgi:Uma2 family endonuclease